MYHHPEWIPLQYRWDLQAVISKLGLYGSFVRCCACIHYFEAAYKVCFIKKICCMNTNQVKSCDTSRKQFKYSSIKCGLLASKCKIPSQLFCCWITLYVRSMEGDEERCIYQGIHHCESPSNVKNGSNLQGLVLQEYWCTKRVKVRLTNIILLNYYSGKENCWNIVPNCLHCPKFKKP